MHYAIIAHPLSSEFQQKLQQTIGAPINYLLVSELRKLSLLNTFFTLRKLNATKILIPLEDSNSQTLLPTLSMLAAVAKTKSIEIVYPDFVRKNNKRSHIIKNFFQVIVASCKSLIAAQKSQHQLKNLLATKRINVSANNPSAITMYLNANLWFGVKAGGSVGHIAGIVNNLADQGFKMQYASVGGKTLINPTIPFTQIHPPKFFGIPTELNYYFFNHLVFKQLSNEYQNLPIHFIYQRNSLANYAGVMLSRHFKTPLVLEYNGSEAWVAKNWGKPLKFHNLAVMAEEANLKHAHLIVTVSDVLRDELIARGVAAEKIVSYPNCIDPKIFNPDLFSKQQCLELRQRYNIAQDATVLTFVGTFGAWHGVEILAKAINSLINHQEAWLQKNKVRFLLVGDGQKMAEVKQILNHHKSLNSYVTLTGLVAQAEAPTYLAASDILLSPHIANADGSKFFGSPTKLFEYMAMGKAILASDLDQIGEVLKNSLSINQCPTQPPSVENSELAMLCKPGNIEELVAGIRFLVENREWREQLGANARKEALAKYTWEQHVNAFLTKLPYIEDKS